MLARDRRLGRRRSAGRGRAARAAGRAPLTSNPLARNGIVSFRVAFEELGVSDLAYQQLADLWEAVFGDKPSVVADPAMTVQVLVSCLPPAEPYSFQDEGED